jgi:hypothetical protein
MASTDVSLLKNKLFLKILFLKKILEYFERSLIFFHKKILFKIVFGGILAFYKII